MVYQLDQLRLAVGGWSDCGRFFQQAHNSLQPQSNRMIINNEARSVASGQAKQGITQGSKHLGSSKCQKCQMFKYGNPLYVQCHLSIIGKHLSLCNSYGMTYVSVWHPGKTFWFFPFFFSGAFTVSRINL